MGIIYKYFPYRGKVHPLLLKQTVLIWRMGKHAVSWLINSFKVCRFHFCRQPRCTFCGSSPLSSLVSVTAFHHPVGQGVFHTIYGWGDWIYRGRCFWHHAVLRCFMSRLKSPHLSVYCQQVMMKVMNMEYARHGTQCWGYKGKWVTVFAFMGLCAKWKDMDFVFQYELEFFCLFLFFQSLVLLLLGIKSVLAIRPVWISLGTAFALYMFILHDRHNRPTEMTK